jgi:hypothetical protein
MADTQVAERSVGLTAVAAVLDQRLRQLDPPPPGAIHDVRFTIEVWVDGVRLYQPLCGAGRLRVAKRSGRARFEPLKNHKGP